jgi:hypothetical protein
MEPGLSTTLEVGVECYAGSMGEETPRAIQIGGGRIEVAEVVDRWLAPGHRYFKLLGKDGDTYLVRNDVVTGKWELTMFQRGGAA